MALDSITINGNVQWSQSKTNSGFAVTKQGSDSKSFTAAPAVATYSEVFLAQYSIAAAGSQVINFNSFMNLLGQSVTATKILGIFLKATGNNGQLKIEPDTSNPLTWFFSGTTPAVTLKCGTGGCMFFVQDGTHFTMSGTVKNLKLSNPGSATITVDVVALVGP